MKIAITGSNGLLGQKLIYALLQHNREHAATPVEIYAIGRGENRLVQQKGYSFSSLDLTNKIEVLKHMAAIKPDVLIHTAAMTNVDQCESEKDACWQNNVLAVEHLIEAIRSIRSPELDPLLIHLSTDFIFDGLAGPYREEDIPNPVSYYGLSKLEAEKKVQQSDIRWCIIRTIIVYGLVDNMSRSNLVLWAKENLSQHKRIKVVNDQFRSPTLAEDLATGCLLAAFKNATGIYNISGSGLYSIIDLVKIVAEEWNLDSGLIDPVSSESLGQAAKRPPRTGFVLSKAMQDLGYKPRSFEEGVKFLRSQLENR